METQVDVQGTQEGVTGELHLQWGKVGNEGQFLPEEGEQIGIYRGERIARAGVLTGGSACGRCAGMSQTVCLGHQKCYRRVTEGQNRVSEGNVKDFGSDHPGKGLAPGLDLVGATGTPEALNRGCRDFKSNQKWNNSLLGTMKS